MHRVLDAMMDEPEAVELVDAVADGAVSPVEAARHVASRITSAGGGPDRRGRTPPAAAR